MQYSFWPVSKRRTPVPRLPLRPPDDYLRHAMISTPWQWRIGNLLHLLGVPLVLLLVTPLLLLYLPVYLWQLRQWERHDPEVNPPLDPDHTERLAAIEGHECTNPFSVFGSLKPGLARRWSMRFFLGLVNYTARHLFTRGGLARVLSAFCAGISCPPRSGTTLIPA